MPGSDCTALGGKKLLRTARPTRHLTTDELSYAYNTRTKSSPTHANMNVRRHGGPILLRHPGLRRGPRVQQDPGRGLGERSRLRAQGTLACSGDERGGRRCCCCCCHRRRRSGRDGGRRWGWESGGDGGRGGASAGVLVQGLGDDVRRQGSGDPGQVRGVAGQLWAEAVFVSCLLRRHRLM